jgi:hypothetical protein
MTIRILLRRFHSLSLNPNRRLYRNRNLNLSLSQHLCRNRNLSLNRRLFRNRNLSLNLSRFQAFKIPLIRDLPRRLPSRNKMSMFQFLLFLTVVLLVLIHCRVSPLVCVL